MKAKNLFFCAIVVFGMNTISHAKDDQFADIDCTQSQDSMLGMKVCANRALVKTEKTLKIKHAALLKHVDKQQRKAANSFIKASATYATALCTMEDEAFNGGSMQTLVHAACLDAEYQRQIKLVDEYVNRPEGQ